MCSSMKESEGVGRSRMSVEDAGLPDLCDPSGPVRQHRIELLAGLLEEGERLSLEDAAARQLDRHRVHETIVDQDFEVHMRAGRQAGRADEADHLALAPAAVDIKAAGERRHRVAEGSI